MLSSTYIMFPDAQRRKESIAYARPWYKGYLPEE
nr:MAG TPA: hypothetical protein [Caudoviricetes sp.]